MVKALITVLAVLCLLPSLPAVGWHAVPTWSALLAGVAVTLALWKPLGLEDEGAYAAAFVDCPSWASERR